jgi:isopentenyl phosphate kinase
VSEAAITAAPRTAAASAGGVSLLIVKIGGSLFSDKRGSRSVDRAALRAYAGALASLWRTAPGRVLMVSGGGAFGHHAVRDLDPDDPLAALPLTEANFSLKWIWVRELASFGCPAVPLQLAALMSRGADGVEVERGVIARLLAAGRLPVLSGDVLFDADGSLEIVGSDRVPALLVGLRERGVRVALLTDVPGILGDGPGGSEVIAEVDAADPRRAEEAIWSTPEWDTSDSMGGKLSAALAIARAGGECLITRGSPEPADVDRLLGPLAEWPAEARRTRVSARSSMPGAAGSGG